MQRCQNPLVSHHSLPSLSHLYSNQMLPCLGCGEGGYYIARHLMRVLWISLQGHGQLEHSILYTVGVSSSILGGKGQKPNFGFLQRNGVHRMNDELDDQWASGSTVNVQQQKSSGSHLIISTSLSHSLKILSPWRKHGTRGIRVTLFLFYGCYCDDEHSSRTILNGRAPRAEISMPTGRGVVDWTSQSDRCLWANVVH